MAFIKIRQISCIDKQNTGFFKQVSHKKEKSISAGTGVI